MRQLLFYLISKHRIISKEKTLASNKNMLKLALGNT